MSNKYFFAPDINEEFCYKLKDIIDMAKDQGLNEIEVIEAERDTGQGYFYCKHFQEVGEVGEGCGNMCDAYKPRNGKNGRCRFSGYCYERTDNKQIIKI
jgi:hypothetical protein